jgi:tetratricopeptide (TPR) repeat protein
MELGRRARDHADVETLQALISTAHTEAAQQNSAAAYEKLAQLDLWLCEVGRDNNNGELVKTAAEDGVDAANKAIALNDNSSEAHRLEGELLGEMIPHVFLGGVRYGPSSSKQLDRAIELDPRNANAYVARGVNYFYTPSAFGGGHDKAIDMLKKAIEVDPTSDLPHLWLAYMYLEEGYIDPSFLEITEARRINPERTFTNHLYEQIIAKKQSSGQ